MKRENEDKEFVSLIEDETRVYKDLKNKVKNKINEEKKESVELFSVENKKETTTEAVNPVEAHHCHCGDDCNCGMNFNKTTILIIILVGLFALGLGTVFGKLYLNEEKESISCPQTKCKELDYQTFYDGATALNQKSDIENFLNESFLSIEEDARTCFVDTENCYSFDEYKVAYVLVNNFEGTGIVKYKELNREVKKIFDSGIERDSFSMKMMLHSGMVNVICSNDICSYDINIAGATGHSFYKYVVKEVKNTNYGYNYIVAEYYVVPRVGDVPTKIYDKEDGTLLYEGNELEFDYKQHVDKLTTYEFEFNSNFKFVSSKKVK